MPGTVLGSKDRNVHQPSSPGSSEEGERAKQTTPAGTEEASVVASSASLPPEWPAAPQTEHRQGELPGREGILVTRPGQYSLLLFGVSRDL